MKNQIQTAIEPRYLMLNGYRSAIADVAAYGVKKGWQCLNCHSMVYLDKCPNDGCYNFQVFTSFTYNLEERIWEMLTITSNSKNLQPIQ